MDNKQKTSCLVAKKYMGCEDIYDELVGDESNSWLFGLVSFAVVEEQKIEWIKHCLATTGTPPSSDEIQQWYKQLPPGALLRAKGTAENALGLFSTEVIEENDKVNLQRIEESIIVGEIKELKRFWPQFGVNLAGGFISSLLFALLLVAIAVIFINNPSPIDLVKKVQQNSEVINHVQK
jgi:hypothetical protein